MKDQKVKNYYNEVADEYNDMFYVRKDEYPPLKYRHKYMFNMISEEIINQECKILDIGCGPGEMCIDLAKKYNDIYGVDISEEMIRIAKKKTENLDIKGSITYEVGDIENLNYEDSFFDAIICSGVVEYLHNDENWGKELKRILKPNGILIINVTNKYAIRRLTLPIINYFKRLKVVYNLLNCIKTRILKKEKLNRFPFIPRDHAPRKFDKFLLEKGFKKISHNYFDFSIFPYPIDTLLNFILLPIRKKMEKYSSNNAKYWGNGYIVKCRKINN